MTAPANLTPIDADFALDPAVGLYWHGRCVPLAPAERQIVAILIASPNATVGWSELIPHVGRNASRESIQVQVSRIRLALMEIGAPVPMISDRGRGYRWCPPRANDVPERSLGFWVKCEPCNHSWVAAYFPAPASEFAEIALKAVCPKCGNPAPVVPRQINGVLAEEQAA